MSKVKVNQTYTRNSDGESVTVAIVEKLTAKQMRNCRWPYGSDRRVQYTSDAAGTGDLMWCDEGTFLERYTPA